MLELVILEQLQDTGADAVRDDAFGPEIREVGLNGQLQLQVNITDVGFSP